MPVISDDQAKSIAQGITAVGGINNYGGGSGGYSAHAQSTPLTLTPAKTPAMNLWQKIGAVATQTANVAGSAVKSTANFVKNTPKYVYHDVQPFLQGIASTVTGEYTKDLKNISDQNKQLEANQKMYMQLYKSGKMSKENYSRLMTDLANSYQDLSKQSTQIAAKTDRGNVVESAAMTAADILAVGRFTGSRAVTPQIAARATQLGGKAQLASVVTSEATKLEELATKIPAVRSLVLRNAEILAKDGVKQMAGEGESQFIQRAGKDLAIGLILKRPIVYQTNIGSAHEVYDNILQGDYSSAVKTAALQATQLLDGGPIGAFMKSGGWIKNKLGELSYGNESLIDNLSKEIGTKEPGQIANYLHGLDKSSPEFKNAEKIYRIMQETNLRVSDENVGAAVRNILSNYDYAGIPRESITPQKLVQDYQNWHEAAKLVDGLSRVKGLNSDELKNLVVVRWDSVMKRGLAGAILRAGDNKQDMAAALSELASKTSNGWSNNPTLMAQLTRIVDESASAEEAAARIKAIPTALAIPDNIPKGVSKKLSELGYGVAVPEGGIRKTPIVDYNDTRKLVSSVVESDRGSNIFEAATAPMPVFGTIATGLEKAGLSPRSASQVASRQLAQSVVANLEEVGVARGLGFTDKEGNVVTGGQVILSKLQKYVNDTEATTIGKVVTLGKARSALTDIRQMTISEVKKALDVSHADAKAVSKAVMRGYTDTPLEYRGLGDHIIDYAFRINPLQKYYSRIQSALRYSYNPFFALQEGVETSSFAGLSGGNRITNLVSHNLLWNKSREELDATVQYLDKSGIFSSSLAGEGAQDLVLGRLTADITPAQKRDLAGLALDLAKNQGKDLQSMVRDNPDQIGDALRIIVQYPRKGFLASSMARTMNVAFFPMRYNLKVTKMAADILAKQPPTVQVAFMHSMLNMKDWLKSDEGIRWQSQHTDAIQVFNWITPINSISSVMNLLGHKPDAIGEIGQLGGLPFGVISQILDSEGIIHLNTPYVNPSTGDVLPKYIPETTKAKAATAIQDLLGSMFTYPGRILGLPGKQQTINDVVRSFIDTNGTDFVKEDQMNRLTPLEQNWVRVLKGDTSKAAVDALYTAPTPGQFNWYTIPPLNVPQPFVAPSEVRVTTNSEIAAAKKAKKAAKKAATGGRDKPIAKLVGQY